MYTELLMERDSLAGSPVYPVVLNNAAISTGTTDMRSFARIQFVGIVGVAVAASNISCYIQGTNNANGSGAVNMSTITGLNGTAITNIVNTAGNISFTLEISATQMGPFRYAIATIGESANKGATVSLIPIATCHEFGPANGSDNGSVVQRVAAVNS